MISVVLLFAISALAGCISDEVPSTNFKATARNGAAFEGWGYAGNGTSLGNASVMTIDVDEALNTGSVRVEGVWPITIDGHDVGAPFTIIQTHFEHNADDFHSGGIAANFLEHGDSGVGDTNLPKMNLLLASWGTAELQINGTTVPDVYGAEDVWSMHLMVTDTGIRDDDTGAISNAAGAPYDPANPGDAVTTDDLEAILVIQSSYPNETRTSENGTFSKVLDNRDNKGQSFDVASPGATIHVVVDFGGDQGELGPYNVRLTDPGGIVLAQGTAGATQATSGAVTSRIELSATSRIAGSHLISISTNGVGGDFDGSYAVDYPAKPRFVLHFEDVVIDQRVG